MRKTVLRAAMLAVAALAGIGATAGMAAAKGNWIATVSTGDVSHTIGNPDAPVKLTEYLSYTCPHCGAFAREGEPRLELGYIPSGNVQFEVRHFIRDKIDLTAALIAWCGEPKDFRRNQQILFSTQPDWIETVRQATDGQRQWWNTGTGTQQRQAIAHDAGFYKLFASRYGTTQVDDCLANQALADRLQAATEGYAKDPGVLGTPSFALNGVLLAGTYDWAMLEPQIVARLPEGTNVPGGPAPAPATADD